MPPPPSLRILLALAALPAVSSCGPRTWEPALHESDAGPPVHTESIPFLKAHLVSGDLVVFRTWRTSGDGDALVGDGVRYDVHRRPVDEGPVTLPADSIALLESNRPQRVGSGAHGTLIGWTALSGVTAVACLADPKSCFGSCPTFYLEDTDGESLVAEGFSSSFARILEATDLDAIGTPDVPGSSVTLLMRNEAPETHAVRSVRLLAVPLGGPGTVVATERGRLYRAGPAAPAVACRGAGGPCLDRIVEVDGIEYASPADSFDLGAKEDLEVEFEAMPGNGELALSLRARASLLSTFLFYHTIATLGSRAGDWLAELERGRPEVVERSLGLARALGDVEVWVQDAEGSWRRAGGFGEAGPIASDEQVVPLGELRGRVRVRLRMTRGNWRIDRVALVRLGERLEPVVLRPSRVEEVGPVAAHLPRHGRDERLSDPGASLLDPDRYLVTHRGDTHRITFDLPGPARGFALFLESRGYYYEWMRGEWRGEEDPALAGLIFSDPAGALRRLAPVYKAREAGMEHTFQSSRFRGGVR